MFYWRQKKLEMYKINKIPSYIIISNFRPDMEIAHQLGIIELTIPGEHRIKVANKMKVKYAPIVKEAKQKGWRVRIWAV